MFHPPVPCFTSSPMFHLFFNISPPPMFHLSHVSPPLPSLTFPMYHLICHLSSPLPCDTLTFPHLSSLFSSIHTSFLPIYTPVLAREHHSNTTLNTHSIFMEKKNEKRERIIEIPSSWESPNKSYIDSVNILYYNYICCSSVGCIPLTIPLS